VGGGVEGLVEVEGHGGGGVGCLVDGGREGVKRREWWDEHNVKQIRRLAELLGVEHFSWAENLAWRDQYSSYAGLAE